jgi:general nucleoside transport system ATP-binding protein
VKVVELNNICKDFGDVKANQGVCFELEEGEIHALLGENGAGKTTLMNILYGLYSCDNGDICINGETVDVDNPKTAIDHGIGMVHQHFMLIPQMTVTQNIFLGMKEAGFFLDLKELNKEVADINERFGFNVSPEALVWQLPVGVQQKVEILKALIRKAKIIILDEPTAVLTPQEVEEFFSSVKMLTKEGYSVILITHKIEEVMKYCDRVTVMREGEVVDTVEVSDTDLNELARMMVGREVFLERNMPEVEKGDVMFAVKDLRVLDNRKLPAVRDISFEIRGGEILGIAGVDGNGQLELGEALVGLRDSEGGTITICGEEKHNPTPGEMLACGLAHIPDDRQKKGLVLQFPVMENLIMGSQRDQRHHDGPVLNYQRIADEALELVEKFDVRPRKIDLPAGSLSGGNQQKVILAREISRNPEVLVAMQPTRGLDIGAIEFVRRKIVEERNKGKAVLLISTDMDEILTMSDRIAVMYKGEILDFLPPDTPVQRIGLLMGGIREGQNNDRNNEAEGVKGA